MTPGIEVSTGPLGFENKFQERKEENLMKKNYLINC